MTNSWDDRSSYLPLPRGKGDVDLDEVLFEYQVVGNSVRVAAIDPRTNTEVVVVGSPNMTPYSLRVNAVRKLQFVLAKKKAEKQSKR